MADSPYVTNIIVNETRIQDVDGFCGTVAYVGPVASAKNQNEVYAGIIWDDASRGKHDGSVICRTTNQLIRHFHAGGPTQGSFLKASKLNVGIPLTKEILLSKYVELQAPQIAPNNILPHSARTSSGREKPIEFLGELKLRPHQQLSSISKVSLRRCGISSVALLSSENTVGNEDDNFTRNVVELDLAGNLLCNWEPIIQILQTFSNLKELSVAWNRIGNPKSDNEHDVLFPKLQVLNLNTCQITSPLTLLWISNTFPNLQELCIANADLSQDGISNDDNYDFLDNDSFFTQLKVLDISNCKLSCWENQICKLFGKLPNLEHLSANDNAIQKITPLNNSSSISSVKPTSLSFPSLTTLQISGTKFENWIDVEGLNTFSALQALRWSSCPLLSTMGQAEARAIVIARFPNLKQFNASMVSSKERTEAERRYVIFVTRLLDQRQQQQQSLNINNCDNDIDDDKEKTTREWIQQHHPQYPRLLEQYKDLIISRNASADTTNGTSLASNICNVTIRSMAPSSCNMEPCVRRLPGTLPVGRLKALCARYFGLDVDLQTLHFQTDADSGFPTELDNDDNPLEYYGVCDGAEIFMNEIDLHAKQQESIQAKQERDRVIQQQEQEAYARQSLVKQQQQ